MTKPSRIKPPMGEDNAWWWEQAARDKLVIQRCARCEVLRHPPRPMCDSCRSIEWDFIEATGRGQLASFTVLHQPQVPGYEYPLTIALVEPFVGDWMAAARAVTFAGTLLAVVPLYLLGRETLGRPAAWLAGNYVGEMRTVAGQGPIPEEQSIEQRLIVIHHEHSGTAFLRSVRALRHLRLR